MLATLFAAGLLLQAEPPMEMPDPETASPEEINAYLGYLEQLMNEAETPQDITVALSRMIYEGSQLSGAYEVDDVYRLTTDIGYTLGLIFGYLDNLEGDYAFTFNFNFDNYDHQTRPTTTETVQRPEDEETREPAFCERGDVILDEAEGRLHNERVHMCLGDFRTETGYEIIRQMVRVYRYDTPQEYGNGFFLMNTDFSTDNPEIIPVVTEYMEELIEAVNRRLTLNVDLEN